MMRRWFSSSKSYELSADQVSQAKLAKERQTKSAVDSTSGSTKLVSQDEKSVAEQNVEVQTAVAPVAINLKETTVEPPKKSHRRQKSSGNWQMLLGDSAQPLEPQPVSHEYPKATNGSASNSDDGSTASQPVRLPVSSKEARPLSFFQKISADQSIRHSDSKPKRAEIFPWGERKTPSPSPSAGEGAVNLSISKTTDNLPSASVDIYAADAQLIPSETPSNQKLKMDQYKARLSRISQSVEDELPSAQLTKPQVTDVTVETDQDEDIINRKLVEENGSCEPFSNVAGEETCPAAIDVEIMSRVSVGTNSTEANEEDNRLSMLYNDNADGPCDITTNSETLPLPYTRAIHKLENQHVKRNSDPGSVKRKRRHSPSKRKSFPESLGKTLSESQEVDMEMKCEILKISTIDAEVSTTDHETFVLVDPALENLDGHVRRVSVRSFTDATAAVVEESSDTESERYRLAEATGETFVDTTSEESSTSGSHMDTTAASNECNGTKYLMLPDSSSKSNLRRHWFKSSTELSSLSTIAHSFDDASLGGSDKGSLRSFKSSLSNKSYSVNDLSLLERPSGFGTLDMNRLVGSFQMLDSIISEHTVPTRKCSPCLHACLG